MNIRKLLLLNDYFNIILLYPLTTDNFKYNTNYIFLILLLDDKYILNRYFLEFR